MKIADRSHPPDLAKKVCETGIENETADGSVWISATSQEGSGRFPAEVSVSELDGELKLDIEATNLVGATQAIIKVRGEDAEVSIKGRKKTKNAKYWNGIPLRWAAPLFLGQIPCPSDAAFEKSKVVDNRLVMEEGTERFEYKFSWKQGQESVDELIWKDQSNQKMVSFKFDQFDADTGGASAWSVSSVDGDVKVKWRSKRK